MKVAEGVPDRDIKKYEGHVIKYEGHVKNYEWHVKKYEGHGGNKETFSS